MFPSSCCCCCCCRVPEVLLHFALRVLAPFMYHLVVQMLKRCFNDPMGELSRRLAQRTELYGNLRLRVGSLFKRQENIQQQQQQQQH